MCVDLDAYRHRLIATQCSKLTRKVLVEVLRRGPQRLRPPRMYEQSRNDLRRCVLQGVVADSSVAQHVLDVCREKDATQ